MPELHPAGKTNCGHFRPDTLVCQMGSGCAYRFTRSLRSSTAFFARNSADRRTNTGWITHTDPSYLQYEPSGQSPAEGNRSSLRHDHERCGVSYRSGSQGFAGNFEGLLSLFCFFISEFLKKKRFFSRDSSFLGAI